MVTSGCSRNRERFTRADPVTWMQLLPIPGASRWGRRTSRDLATMCQDARRFQELNPDGYLAGTTAPTALAPVVGAPK